MVEPSAPASEPATPDPAGAPGPATPDPAGAPDPAAGPGAPVRAFLGLGSNLGDRAGQLRDAVARLEEVAALSSVYETEALGGPPQGPYLNLVVELRTRRTPRQLLAECHRLESLAGRTRTVRFGPRTLDVDILLVGELQVREVDLVVPHPRMWERRFVLVPLAELAPELVAPEALDSAGGEVRRVGRLPDVDVIA